MPNSLYKYILNIYDLVWLGFIAYQLLWVIQCHIYILIYIYIKYISFGLVGCYGISTIVSYLMPNPIYTYILNIYDLVGFYGITTIVGYLMPNPLYTYILNIYDFIWLSFMAYQPL